MNQQDRAKVGRLIQILEDLRASDSEMPLQHALAFLYVASGPGINVTELAKKQKTTVQSASRHYKALGRQVSPGSQLVVAGYGVDARTKALLLSDDGRKLANRMIESLNQMA